MTVPKFPDDSKQDAWIREVEAKQHNLVWPDAMRNNRGVDALLFKGDPNAPLVQRIGCWIFGCSMLFVTAFAFVEFQQSRSTAFIPLGAGSALFGGWVFSRGFVGFRRRKRHKRS